MNPNELVSGHSLDILEEFADPIEDNNNSQMLVDQDLV
jgi:hypothetical protein